MKKKTTFFIILILLLTSNLASAKFILDHIQKILENKNFLCLVKSYKNQGYELYSIRDRRIAFNETLPRDMYAYYRFYFAKMENYKLKEKCWLDVNFMHNPTFPSKLKCYSSSKFDPNLAKNYSTEEITRNFKDVSNKDIFNYGNKFQESVSSTGKSTLFINSSNGKLKAGAFWDDGFKVIEKKVDKKEYVIKDGTGFWKVTFSDDYESYDVSDANSS